MYMAEDPVAVRSIILGLINSDGSTGVNTKTITFTSTSWSIIQWINNVAVIGGFTTSFRGICHETSVHNPVYKILILDNDYTINNDSRNPDSKVRITNKTEAVYCVTVSTGLIIVRGDNEVTSICGNCAMLEHGTVYLAIPYNIVSSIAQPHFKYRYNKYSKVNNDMCINNDIAYVATNFRVLIENDWLDDLKYICEPTEFHEKRITVKFILSRSIAPMESQRYCNYSKSKFNNEVTFIIPCWIDIPSGVYTNLAQQNLEDEEYKQIILHENDITTPEGRFLWELLWSERGYFDLLSQGWKPQQAREVLPNACKTELVMTGSISDWKYFFGLRCDKAAHPQAQELAIPLKEEFIKRGYITK